MARLTQPAIGSAGPQWAVDWNENFEALDLGGAIQFAHRYANVQAAIDALPADGGIVDARHPSVNKALGTIDPGSKVVTLLLGPYAYTATQIKLRDSFKLLGSGNGGNAHQTVIQSASATTSLFVLTSTVPITGVEIGWLRLYGQAGYAGATAQSAIYLIAQSNGGGCWWSKFHHLTILGFKGVTSSRGIICLDGTAGGTPPGENQFLIFEQVECYRPSGGGPVLEMLGFNGQVHFTACHFDSNSGVTTGKNITIKDTSSSLFPFSLTFDDVTVQGGDIHIEIAGGNRILFSNMHHEAATTGAYLISAAVAALSMISIRDSQFNNNIGLGAGGYIVNVVGPSSAVAVLFVGNNYGSPDSVIAGNVAAVTRHGNTGGGSLVGGTLWDEENSFPYLDINTGVKNNGTGFKHKRNATGTVTAGARKSVTITWLSAFLDANYTVSCIVLDSTAATSPGLICERIVSISSAAAVVSVYNPTAGDLSGTLHAVAVHD